MSLERQVSEEGASEIEDGGYFLFSEKIGITAYSNPLKCQYVCYMLTSIKNLLQCRMQEILGHLKKQRINWKSVSRS